MNKLRLVGSCMKNEVDRFQCLGCSATISFPDDMDDGGPTGVPVSANVHFRRPLELPPAPAMWLPHRDPLNWQECYAGKPQAAIQHAAQHRPVWININCDILLWDMISAAYGEGAVGELTSPLLQILETTSGVRMLHTQDMFLDSVERLGATLPAEASLELPSEIKRLHLRLWDDECSCRIRLGHSAETLRISLDRALEAEVKQSPLCCLSLDVFKPCVKHLSIQVDLLDDAVVYLQAIRGKPRHSQLSVSVRWISPHMRVLAEQPPALREQLTEMLGVPVSVTLADEAWPIR
ncbi:hypothetical protein A1Q2_02675 [Trichosporon asahii var. asahii CBS 8904]|uniref:Uncharacterized protein n=1 Tax=Trichosporon asahii var. asahii (strain CBS 8904) TaxID=1220162 RepID=K1VG00_TRIAC|nr:hypothetical protein A1Q2_02675 [Trichosporon asahii var. asahii CBS 8904]